MGGYNIEIDVKKDKEIWYPVLKQWIDNNIKYIEESKFEDAIYWHNEMANVACISSAIWQVNGVSTIEYTMTKNQNKDYGRADLYCVFGKKDFLIEVKFLKSENKITKKQIEDKLNECFKYEKDKTKEEIDKLSEEYFKYGKNINKISIVFILMTDIQKIEEYNDYSIKARLTINENKLEYDKKNYNSIYLFGKYLDKISS